MSETVGMRVGAILGTEDNVVRFLGYGVYEGEEVPPDGPLHSMSLPNPKIKLDTGEVVWGYQCWWGPEQKIKGQMDTYVSEGWTIEPITMTKAMEEYEVEADNDLN